MIDTFMAVFRQKLAELHALHPEMYAWPIWELDNVCGRMRIALLERTYNTTGKALKATCKKLNIKPTYKAITAYLERLET